MLVVKFLFLLNVYKEFFFINLEIIEHLREPEGGQEEEEGCGEGCE